jgi:hypothetical protein
LDIGINLEEVYQKILSDKGDEETEVIKESLMENARCR